MEKIAKPIKKIAKIKISREDIFSEFNHLKNKLKKRDSRRYKQLLKIKKLYIHPLFIS